jgi:Ca2+-binding RTX toxin-like protein
MMNNILYWIIMMMGISLVLTQSVVSASVNLSSPINSSSFEENLKSKIQNLISNALNDTDNITNSSFISNGSNHSSSNIIVSNNKVMSTVNSNNGTSSSINDQVKTINGECSSIKVGGNGNDTIASAGNCNDEITGGRGADKFTCGEGNDTIKDFNPNEGDVIFDKQNCETVLKNGDSEYK